jgi:hypothetical protein
VFVNLESGVSQWYWPEPGTASSSQPNSRDPPAAESSSAPKPQRTIEDLEREDLDGIERMSQWLEKEEEEERRNVLANNRGFQDPAAGANSAPKPQRRVLDLEREDFEGLDKITQVGGYNYGPGKRKGVLAKSRKFQDAYEDYDRSYPPSSGSSKKVMDLKDFFRRMGKQRAGGQ